MKTDVLVLAHKAVSKAERRIRRLDEIEPGERARELAVAHAKDPRHVQAILDEAIQTPTRSAPRVLLEEIDGHEVVLRIQATPERAEQGAQLADEIIAALSAVTDEHALSED